MEAGIAPDSFVNSIALNLYYGEGIQSHFDDATRFQQPILSLRLFSDSRLSFGTHLYGTNGLFFIPLPRGCIMGAFPPSTYAGCNTPASLVTNSVQHTACRRSHGRVCSQQSQAQRASN